MSRVLKPYKIPSNVKVTVDENIVSVTSGKFTKQLLLNSSVKVTIDANEISFSALNNITQYYNHVGTARANLINAIKGVTVGFSKKLELVGVGYRASAKGNILSLSLGFSHPIEYNLPDGVIAETPTQTEIVLKGDDRQKIGQVAAEIRSFRPPEPYKGKGVRYSGEKIVMKEAKKK
jgi:large subunit ribosomal protein L6